MFFVQRFGCSKVTGAKEERKGSNIQAPKASSILDARRRDTKEFTLEVEQTDTGSRYVCDESLLSVYHCSIRV